MAYYSTAHNPATCQSECRCLECGKVVAAMTDAYFKYMSTELGKGPVRRNWLAMTLAAQMNHNLKCEKRNG